MKKIAEYITYSGIVLLILAYTTKPTDSKRIELVEND
jgi:hypothetical protein